MPNLETNYMGLKLKNPVIAGSSGITKSADKVAQCEDAGAGAVVLKSLFEEVLADEDFNIKSNLKTHPEVADYEMANLEMMYGPAEYCDLIRAAKEKVDIPVIASINCVSNKWWPNFASQIASAGADAIELNVFKIPADPVVDAKTVEDIYLKIAESVKENVDLPVAIKLGPNFSSLINIAAELASRKIDALVLFNRFTEPDIDLDNLKIKTTFSFTSQEQFHLPFRWIALLSGQIKTDLAATHGIKTYKEVAKMILAGASAVQIASVLYEKGLGVIKEITDGLEAWMDQHAFTSLDQIRGKLDFRKTRDPEQYLRTQFMEKTANIE